MKDLAAKFLSEKDKDKIRNAVKEAEKTTSGEIVPMIVSSSYAYPVSNIIGGLASGIIIALATALIFKSENLWLFLPVFMGSFLIMHEVIKYILPFKRLLISDREINAEVEEAAINAFYRNELYKTRDKTGVLIFISVFERKVWVLADKGINSKVDTGAWQELVNIIVNGIKENKQGEAICKAIAMVGEILCTHSPIKRDDTDELGNLIVKE